MKGIMSNQMVLNKFHKTANGLRMRERSFRETVSQLIVLSIDVGEWQIMKCGQKIFCLPTPMYKIWWGGLSWSMNLVDDY